MPASTNQHRPEPIESVLARFEGMKENLSFFCERTRTLIEDSLKDAGIRYQSVQARVKSSEKLRSKYLDSRKSYQSLDDIKDLAALRVITYYDDEVDKVAEIIRREFDVDRQHSPDKRETEPDRFGYYALNLVCSHLPRRTSSVEYKKFDGIWCEVQITSVLRHAWSEIEHDWYDLKDAYPDSVKRKFYRLAALLEIAESEFIALRTSKASYRQSVALQVEANVQSVPLNAVSLTTFVEQEPLVKRLDGIIGSIMGTKDIELQPEFVVRAWARLAKSAKLADLSDLKVALQRHEKHLMNYVRRMNEEVWSDQVDFRHDSVARGVSVEHLCLMLIARNGEKKLRSVTRFAHITNSEREKQVRIAREVLADHSALMGE